MSKILIVEDDPKIQANLLFQLREQGHETTAVDSAEDALALIQSGTARLRPDLMLCDVRLPGASGIELVRQLSGDHLLPPTVVVSGEASISETVDALRLGVHDFIEKPFSKERLLQSIRNALEHSALRREVADLRSELAAESEILGESPPIERLRELIGRAAPTEARVLILGESGSGKELVANAIHRQSSRHSAPFIKLNCAAIPSHLVEDELFGHAKGAFTDARQAKPGLFEEAHGGTLFLDEIGDMEYPLQSRLLRVLEDGRVRRIGETRDREVDVRVIAATHSDLVRAVRERKFREDLYFRLAHLPIEVPPLRHRGDDVRLLFEHFVEIFCRRHRLRTRQVDDSVYPFLDRYPWPGNVRELRNICERLVIFGSDPLTPDQLPAPLQGGQPLSRSETPEEERNGSHAEPRETGLVRLDGSLPILPLRDFKTQCEKEYIERVLRRTNWNFAAAARLLEIQRTYLHQKAGVLGIRRPRPNLVETAAVQ